MPSKTISPRIRSMYEYANIPKDYWSVSLSAIKDSDYKEKIVEYHDNIRSKIINGDSLFLYGKLGTGKSGCACLLLQKALANGIMGFYTPTMPLQQYSIKDTPFGNNMTMMERCNTVPFLVIDELQLKANKRWVYEVLDDLIRYRIGNKLSTIICSNYGPDKLSDFSVKDEDKDNIYPLEGFVDVCKQAFEVIKVEGQRFRN